MGGGSISTSIIREVVLHRTSNDFKFKNVNLVQEQNNRCM